MSQRRPKPQAPPPAPTGNLYLDYPGLREAEAEARRRLAFDRELSTTDLPLSLCRVAVEQFRLRHWQALAVLRNPIVLGGPIHLEDIAQFLWIISLAYVPDAEAFAAFHAGLALEDGEVGALLAEILEYREDAFQDMRGGSGDSVPSACFSASILHEMQQAYPQMGRQEVFDLTFGEIFQRLRLIEEDLYRAAGRKAPPVITRVDKVRREFVFGHHQKPATHQDPCPTPKPRPRRQPKPQPLHRRPRRSATGSATNSTGTSSKPKGKTPAPSRKASSAPASPKPRKKSLRLSKS